MTERCLQVTYRKGRPFAAYLYLARPTSEKSARTEAAADGLLVIDFAADGRPIGLEITAPGLISRERVNETLQRIGEAPLGDAEFRPLHAA